MRIKLSLLQKALLALLVILLPIMVSFVHSYFENRQHMRKHTVDDLTVIAEAYEGQVYQFLEMVKRRAEDFSTDGYIVSGLERALKGEKGAAEALTAHLRKNKLPLDSAIFRISLIGMDGCVLASTDPSRPGNDVSGKRFFRTAASGKSAIEEEQVSSGTPEIIASAPVFDGSGSGQIGVIAIAQHLSGLSRVLTGELNRELGALTWSKGKRETMEAYIVNRDSLMITESRFMKDVILRQRVDNEAVRLCLGSNQEFSGFYVDYRGVEVSGASMCLPSLGWTLLVEVDSSEILAPVQEMKKAVIWAALAATGLIVVVFYAFYRNTILRLAALSSASSAIAAGRYDISVPVESGDEIARLSANFNRMSSEIRTRTALIQKSEEKYRSLVANIPDITWTCDGKGDVTYVSENVRDLLGYSPEEVYSPGFWESIIHSEDRGRIIAAFDSLFESGRRFDEQYRMMRRDGSWAWVYDRAVSTYEKDGGRFADGLLTDMTERRMADVLQSLAHHLEEAEDLEAAARTAISRVCEVTGWSYGEVWTPRPDGAGLEHSLAWQAGRPDSESFARASVSLSLSPEAGLPGRVLQEKRPVWLSDASANGDDFVRAERARVAGMRSALGVPVLEGGRVLAVLVFMMSEPLDRNRSVMSFVSAVASQLGSSLQKKRAEEARREIQQRYDELLNSITVGVYRDALAPDGRLIEVNKAVVAMLDGSSEEEVLSRGAADFYVDKGRRAELGRLLETQGFIRGEEAELVTLKGRRIWVSVTALKKAGPDWKDYADGILEDITERKKLEEQLRHSQKLEAVGQLAGGVAHDFNNILTAIIGYGNLLLMKKGEDEVVRDYAEHVLTLSEKAAHLTQSLLAFSRKQVMNPQPVELNGLIKRVEKIMRVLLGEDIVFNVSLSGQAVMVKADSTQIEQVLMNLATNARDSMKPGGMLSVSTGIVELGPEFSALHGYGQAGTFAMISVSDTGHGMDAETQKRIFEPFFTTKEVGKGTGLGLAVVYGIVKQHGGFINVYSEPGIGSTFKVYLPIIDAREEVVAGAGPNELLGGHELILLAEDEQEVREVNRSILQEFGYEVIDAVDGEDAVGKFMGRKDEISLVILDLVMPRMNGKEAFEEMAKARPGVKAVFMSGYAVDLMRSRGALGAGAEFISKPVSPGELLKKVRETIQR